jgi:hypothetical protein
MPASAAQPATQEDTPTSSHSGRKSVSGDTEAIQVRKAPLSFIKTDLLQCINVFVDEFMRENVWPSCYMQPTSDMPLCTCCTMTLDLLSSCHHQWSALWPTNCKRPEFSLLIPLLYLLLFLPTHLLGRLQHPCLKSPPALGTGAQAPPTSHIIKICVGCLQSAYKKACASHQCLLMQDTDNLHEVARGGTWWKQNV